MFGGKPFSGAREAGLDFVGDKKDAVLAADILQKLEIVARWNDEATFALNWFDNQGRYGFRRDGTLERVFEMMRKVGGTRARWIAIRIGEGNAINVAGERLKAGFVRMCLAGERHSEKRAAVESVLETNDGGPFRISARDLDGVFNRFGAGIEKDSFFREIAGSERVQLFGDSDVAFVWRDREAQMKMLFQLLLNRGDDPRSAMSNIEAANSPRKIDVAVAVDVFDSCAVSTRGEHGCGVGGPARDGNFATRHQRA